MKKELIVFITILLVVSACSKRIYEVAYPTLSDGRYDTEFPYKSCSAELAEISKSVRKLNSIAYYKSYVFAPNSEVLKSQILKKDYEDNISKEIFYNNSVIGTATVVSYKYRRIALVTCAHIIDFPDTIFNYIVDKSGVRTPFLQSVAFKERQRNFVADFPERGELKERHCHSWKKICDGYFLSHPGFQLSIRKRGKIRMGLLCIPDGLSQRVFNGHTRNCQSTGPGS
jgi:hypothetical protein